MNVENVFNDLKKELKEVFKDEPMSRHTSFRVGGPADILVIPQTAEELKNVLKYANRGNYPLFIMGNGSNLIVKDKGIRGIVIKILENFNSISVKDDIIEAEAGALLSRLSNFAMKEGLAGIEFACGVPGTLGGAIVMNAGAYGGQMSDVIEKTEYMTMDGEISILEKNKHNFGYRTSFFSKENYIILKAILKLTKCSTEEIKRRMDMLTAKRIEKQPLSMPSAGSIFKRPEGYYTGKLIEDAGLRGYSFGGAQISEKHTGFIVNKGGATAKDIIGLVQYVKDTVQSRFGVELDVEVRIVGEE